jgi:hypothetical protein
VHDEKFIDIFIDKFYQFGISNKIFCLKTKINYTGKHNDEVERVIPFSKLYFELIKSNHNYDYIIVYNLDYEKAYFINRLNKGKHKLIWNFFGTEIYNNSNFSFLKKLYATQTRSLMGQIVESNLKKRLRWIKYAMKGRLTPNAEVQKAIKKINYFAWYSREEYDYLKNQVKYLPPFLPYPIGGIVPNLERKPVNIENKILVGNSRAPENNHLEILLILEKTGFCGEVILPFSYGIKDSYSEKLKEKVKLMPLNIKFLEDFLPYNEYIDTVTSCSVAVYNSYRQMALGNILISIFNDTKVYLSEKNISYKWFENLGFKIYSIETQLTKDILENNLQLSDHDKITNQQVYNKLTSKNKIDEFLKTIWDRSSDEN